MMYCKISTPKQNNMKDSRMAVESENILQETFSHEINSLCKCVKS
jgi:hypothetical protein